MKRLPNNRHSEANVLLAAFHLPQNLHLDIEELLELKPLARLLHSRCILGEMDIAERFAQAHEAVALHNIHAERVHHALLLEFGNEVRDNSAKGLGVKSRTLHSLGGVVVRFESLHELGLHLRHRRELGVDEIVLVIEARRFAKKQILHIALQFDILDTLEPDELNGMSSVCERSREALGSPYANSMPLGDMTDNLHIGVIIINLVDKIEATAVDILIRKLVQHIEGRFHTQLFTKNVGTFRADTLTVFYISNG